MTEEEHQRFIQGMDQALRAGQGIGKGFSQIIKENIPNPPRSARAAVSSGVSLKDACYLVQYFFSFTYLFVPVLLSVVLLRQAALGVRCLGRCLWS